MAIDHTKYNYQEIIERIAKILSENSSNPAVWKDTNYSSTSQVLVQLVAAITDDLQYMLERRTQESYLPTARLLSSVGAIANGMGYRPRRMISSKGTIQMNLDNPVASGTQVKIPAYTPMKYDGIDLVIIGDVVIQQGIDEVYFTVSEGIVENIQIDANTGTLLTNTSNRVISYDTNTMTMLIDKYGDIENSSILIRTLDSAGNVVDQYFDVSVKNPVTGEAPIGALSLASPTDAAFDVRMSNDGLSIIFGDDSFGKKPTDIIDIRWIRSAGSKTTIPSSSTKSTNVYDETFTNIGQLEVQLNTGTIDGVTVTDGMRILCNGFTTEDKRIYTAVQNGSLWNLNPVPETVEPNTNTYIKYGTNAGKTYAYNASTGAWEDVVIANQISIPSYPTLNDNNTPTPNTYNYNIINTTPIAGGLEPESVNDIKRHAPDYVKTNNRAVTKHDFEYWTKASGIGGIVDAKAYGEEEIGINPLGYTANNVYVTYLRKDKTELNQTELQQLKDWLNEYKQVTSIVVIQQATNIPLVINVTYTPNPQLNISTNQTIDYIKAALRELFTAKEDSLGSDRDHSEIVQHLHNYKVQDQGGLEKNLVLNVTVDVNAIKEFDFSGTTEIVDSIPINVLKVESPPENHFKAGSILFQEDGTNAAISSPETCVVRFAPEVTDNTKATGLQSGTVYNTKFVINGTDYTISFDGNDALTFADLEQKIQTELNAVTTGITVKMFRHLFVYGDNTQNSIAIDESGLTNQLFSSCTGYKDTHNTGSRPTMTDVAIDANSAFVGVGVFDYITGGLVLVKGTWLPDNVFVQYQQDDRMNFKVSQTQILDFDEDRSTFVSV